METRSEPRAIPDFSHVWQDVAHVVVVVHGVGEPTQLSLIKEARDGLVCFKSTAPVEEEDLLLESVPLPRGVRPPVLSRLMQFEQEQILLVPLAWSSIHERVASAMIRAKFSGVTTGTAGAAWAAFYPIFRMAGTCMSCVSHAKRPWQRALLVLASFAITVLSVLLVFVLFLLVGSVISYIMRFRSPHGMIGALPVIILGSLLLMILQIVLRHSLGIIDLPGDVTFYVSCGERQSLLHEEFVAFIEFFGRVTRGAPITIVSHSLGAVLSANALSGAEPGPLKRGQVHLITMGCPLRSMHQWFATSIRSADVLSTEMAQKHVIGRWVNIWKSGDSIGRDIFDSGSAIASEMQLGEGGHGGYLGMPELWKLVLASSVEAPTEF